MIRLALVRPDEADEAFEWHLAFAARHRAIYPRKEPQFRQFVDEGWVWAARIETNEIVGMAYAVLDGPDWELGGLMVREDYRKNRGLGSLLMRVALGHMLFEQDPLHAAPPTNVITHVLHGNDDPRTIIERRLGFAHRHPVSIHGSILEGLPTCDHGFVHGDEYILEFPRALPLLEEWATNWTGTLRDGEPAQIKFRRGVNLPAWREAFAEWAKELA
ncbi:MAG TPA: GNAT family N-acetyltransferase [Allosphingosinicella sp.]|nr:GNAT family N-acetyltransferase [Allosphingosinicella sp.]